MSLSPPTPRPAQVCRREPPARERDAAARTSRAPHSTRVLSASRRFGTRSVVRLETPVRFLPGRASFATTDELPCSGIFPTDRDQASCPHLDEIGQPGGRPVRRDTAARSGSTRRLAL